MRIFLVEMERREYEETRNCGDILLPYGPGRRCPHAVLGELWMISEGREPDGIARQTDVFTFYALRPVPSRVSLVASWSPRRG